MNDYMHDNLETPGFRKSRALSSENLLEQEDYLGELNMNIKKQNKDFKTRQHTLNNKTRVKMELLGPTTNASNRHHNIVVGCPTIVKKNRGDGLDAQSYASAGGAFSEAAEVEHSSEDDSSLCSIDKSCVDGLSSDFRFN